MSIKTRTKDTHKNTFQKIQNKLIAVPSEVHVEGSGRPREETGTWDFTTFFWVFYCGLLPWISVIYLQKKVVSHASSCLSSKSCLCFKQQIYKMHNQWKPHWILSFSKHLSHLSPTSLPCPRVSHPSDTSRLETGGHRPGNESPGASSLSSHFSRIFLNPPNKWRHPATSEGFSEDMPKWGYTKPGCKPQSFLTGRLTLMHQ